MLPPPKHVRHQSHISHKQHLQTKINVLTTKGIRDTKGQLGHPDQASRNWLTSHRKAWDSVHPSYLEGLSWGTMTRLVRWGSLEEQDTEHKQKNRKKITGLASTAAGWRVNNGCLHAGARECHSCSLQEVKSLRTKSPKMQAQPSRITGVSHTKSHRSCS